MQRQVDFSKLRRRLLADIGPCAVGRNGQTYRVAQARHHSDLRTGREVNLPQLAAVETHDITGVRGRVERDLVWRTKVEGH